MTTPDILDRLEEATGLRPRRSGNGFVARCPAHDDKTPSLSVTGVDGRTLLHCHAGCETDEVVEALGLRMADLFHGDGAPSGDPAVGEAVSARRAKVPAGYELEGYYPYLDAAGNHLYSKLRFERKRGVRDLPKKTFQFVRPVDGPDKFVVGLDGVEERPLYRLPDVAQAVANKDPVVVVEGERDVGSFLRVLTPYYATCSDGGAGVWRPEHTAALAGTDVVVVADNDAPGLAHAEKVCGALLGSARSVRLLTLGELPDGSPMPEGGDITDWLDAADAMGGVDTADALIRLLERAEEFVGMPEPLHSPRAGGVAPARGDGAPAEVYRLITPTIATACMAYDRLVERWAFLVSLITVLAGLAPNVSIKYGREVLSLHMFTFLVGGPATGKNVIKVAATWANEVDRKLDAESRQQQAEWELQKEQRDRLRKSRSKKADDELAALENLSALGERPPSRFVLMGGDVTQAGLVDALHDNPDGVVMVSTEADAVAEANARQHGGFSPMLRMAFHNERHSETRRGGEGRIVVESPRLGVLLAGTEGQVEPIFTKGIEDGLFSRFAFVELERTSYESQMEASGDEEFERVMRVGAQAATSIYGALASRERDLRVHFPKSWWRSMDEENERRDEALFAEGEDALTAVVRRGPIIAFRIAAVLAVWRAYAEGVDLAKIDRLDVSDDDAEAALLIGFALMDKSLQMASEFGRPTESTAARALATSKAPGVDRAVFAALPDEFASADAESSYGEAEVSRATAYRRLESWREAGVVERIAEDPRRYRKLVTHL